MELIFWIELLEVKEDRAALHHKVTLPAVPRVVVEQDWDAPIWIVGQEPGLWTAMDFQHCSLNPRKETKNLFLLVAHDVDMFKRPVWHRWICGFELFQGDLGFLAIGRGHLHQSGVLSQALSRLDRALEPTESKWSAFCFSSANAARASVSTALESESNEQTRDALREIGVCSRG